MNNLKPFEPSGNTVLITANTSAPAGVQVGTTRGNQLRIHNAGTVVAHVGFGPDAATAQAQSAAATGTGANSKFNLPVPPNQTAIVSIDASMFVSASAASATPLYLTPGRGMT